MGMVSSDDCEGLCLIRQGTCPCDGPVELYCLGQCPMGCTIVVAVVNSATCRWAPMVLGIDSNTPNSYRHPGMWDPPLAHPRGTGPDLSSTKR